MPRILTNIHKHRLAKQAKPFTIKEGVLYHMGQNDKF